MAASRKRTRSPSVSHTFFFYLTYLKDRGLLFTNEHTYVWTTQVCAVNLPVPAPRVDVRKGFVHL